MKITYIIPESFIGLLYENGAFKQILKPGKHEVGTQPSRWGKNKEEEEYSLIQIDMRERSLIIKGQEILTSDKVAIRVSLIVHFKIIDPKAATHHVANYEDRIYEDVQLSARRFLASRSLDSILTDRNDISDAVKEDVKELAESYGVQIMRADVKDLVFPGNLREIMNQVLETERRAEAKIIQAKNEAEAARIQAKAKNESELAKINAEKEMIQMRAEAQLAKLKTELESKKLEAEALKENPELLKILQVEMLKGLAQGGAKIVIGLDSERLKSLTDL